MGKYRQLYRVLRRDFGARVRPLATFGLLQSRHLLDGAARALDHVLFPGFRRTEIRRPVFILGNPRSGTTFLHRFLLRTERYCAFELWEMLFTGITSRRLLRPFVGLLDPLSPARFHGSEAHETGLRDVETDDAMAFFRFLDGGFLWSYFIAWEEEWASDTSERHFTSTGRPPALAERWFRYMEGCWRRNLYLKQRPHVVVKSSLLTLEPEVLLRRYPDCRLIYLVRDPLSTIPSGLSLITGVLERSYGRYDHADPARRARYLENLYQASLHLYLSFEDKLVRGVVPKDRLRVVTYPELMGNLERTMIDLLEFLEIDPDPGFGPLVAEQARKQRSHESHHEYSLARFGLDEGRIRRDLAPIYRRYDLES